MVEDGARSATGRAEAGAERGWARSAEQDPGDGGDPERDRQPSHEQQPDLLGEDRRARRGEGPSSQAPPHDAIVVAMSQTARMQDAFGFVIVGVVIVAAIVALVTLGSARRSYDQIGADGLNDGSDRPAHEPLGGAGHAAVRDDEIRQMLGARNARRVRQGKAPLDVEAELRTLEAVPVTADPGLVRYRLALANLQTLTGHF